MKAIAVTVIGLFLHLVISAQIPLPKPEKNMRFYISLPGITDEEAPTLIQSWSTGINVQDTSFALSNVYFVMEYGKFTNPIKMAIAEKKKFDAITIWFKMESDGKEQTVGKTIYSNAHFTSFNVGGSSESESYPMVSISFEYNEVIDQFYGAQGDKKSPINTSIVKGKPIIEDDE